MSSRVALARADVSEEPIASIIWVTIGEQRTTLAVPQSGDDVYLVGYNAEKTGDPRDVSEAQISFNSRVKE
jgi:hypothetical protein